jgi:hypothetical protein
MGADGRWPTIVTLAFGTGLLSLGNIVTMFLRYSTNEPGVNSNR